MSPEEAVSYKQRQAAEHSRCAREGYNCLTGERDIKSLQAYARKKNIEALNALIKLLGEPA